MLHRQEELIGRVRKHAHLLRNDLNMAIRAARVRGDNKLLHTLLKLRKKRGIQTSIS